MQRARARSSASSRSRSSSPKQFTGTPGAYVPIAETIRGFEEIIEGKHDDIPESAFFLKGTIDAGRRGGGEAQLMARTPSFVVEVLTPEGEVFNEEVEMLSTRTTVGSIGILANHEPVLAMLEPTELRLYGSETEIVRFAQAEGYMQIVRQPRARARGGGGRAVAPERRGAAGARRSGAPSRRAGAARE